MISIELAQVDDAEQIRQLATQGGIDAWTADQYRDEAAKPDSLLLKASDPSGTIVGFVSGRLVGGAISGLDGEIYGIAVSREFKRQGIGRSLLERSVVWFASKQCANIWLEVRTSNSGALQFYENSGFQYAGKRKSFYAHPIEDAIVMKLTIEADLRHGID